MKGQKEDLMMKKILIALVIGFAMFGLAGCTGTATTLDEYKYVTLKINPSIDFVVNKDDKVEEVIPTNVDAEVVVSELNLESMPITEAIDTYVEAAAETGYIDPEEVDNEVTVEVVTEEEEEAEKYCNMIRDRINRYFQNNGIFGAAVGGNFDEYLAKAEAFGINIDDLPLGKVKAIVVALENDPDLDIAELVDMTVGDIIKLISGRAKENEVNAALKDEFTSAREELMVKYARLFELRKQICELKTQIENHIGTDEELATLQANLQVLYDEFNPLQEAYKGELTALRASFKAQSDAAREEQKAKRATRQAEAKAKFDAARNLAKENRQLRREIGKRQKDDEFNPFVTEEERSKPFVDEAQTIRKKYGSFFTLKDELVTLCQELDDFAGSEEEKNALESEIETKRAEFKETRKNYYKEMSNLAKEIRKRVNQNQTGKENTNGTGKK